MPQAIPSDLESRLIVDSVHARLFGDDQPTRIGKYIILRRIGSGAMADVYLGWHEDLERSDAIKLVHPAAQDSTIERRRLLREAQALARLAHDHVIRVHDSGTHGERVYIAMEYVKGQTLGTWQQSRAWREVLGAYLKAGRGLHAAHCVALDDDDRPADSARPEAAAGRHGLVHRDFKPDNVLIGDDGRVRVADFGLAVPVERRSVSPAPDMTGVARRLDVRLTAASDILGTPLYISPEQLLGQPADARSDQYSFCVALYEALYGQHPFYAHTAARRDSGMPTESEGLTRTAPPHVALFEAVLSGPLRAPPRGKVPRRIFAVLARGLQRDPSRRYPSMLELLAALEHDPRRRTLQVLGAALGLGLVGGLFYWQTRPPAACVAIEQEVAGLWDDARRAEVRAAFAATNTPYAATSFATVDHTLIDYLGAWTRSRQQACDATYSHGTRDRALHERTMACLDQRRALASAAIDELRVIDGETVAGAVDRLRSLPRLEDCEHRILLSQTCTVEPDDPESATARDAILRAHRAELSGRYRDAEPVAAAAVSAAEARGLPSLIAEARFIHGRILGELSRPEEAREALLGALDVAEGAACEGLAADLGTWIAKLVALNPALDTQLGVDWSRYSFAKLQRIPEDGLRSAAALLNRGLLRERREHAYGAAEQDYRDALVLNERDREHTLAARAVNYLNLGSVLQMQERYSEALTALQTSLDMYRRAYGEEHPNLWKPLFNIGTAATGARQFAAAEEALNGALALARAAFGPNNRKVLEAHNALSALFLDAEEGARSRDQALLALSICDASFPATEPLCRDSRRLLAQALELLGEHTEALALREQILARMQATGDPDLGEGHLELASSLVALKRWQPALEHADAALARLDAGHPALADAENYRGEALLGLDRPEAAIAPLERALELSAGGLPPPRAVSEWGLARALCSTGREPGRARELARAAREVFAADIKQLDSRSRVADIDQWMTRPCPNPNRP